MSKTVVITATRKRPLRQPTGSESDLQGRWRAFTHDERARRDKLNLDLFSVKDQSLENSENLPEPDELAEEIAEDLQVALELCGTITKRLKG